MLTTPPKAIFILPKSITIEIPVRATIFPITRPNTKRVSDNITTLSKNHLHIPNKQLQGDDQFLKIDPNEWYNQQ